MRNAKRQDITHEHSIGARLKNLRKTKAETQAVFSNRLQVPKSTYVAWERGEAEPPFNLLQKLQSSLGQRAAFQVAGLSLDQNPGQKVDWQAVSQLTREVAQLSRRAGYDFEVGEIVEIAGLIFEKGPERYEDGLRDAERLLRIGKSGTRS